MDEPTPIPYNGEAGMNAPSNTNDDGTLKENSLNYGVFEAYGPLLIVLALSAARRIMASYTFSSPGESFCPPGDTGSGTTVPFPSRPSFRNVLILISIELFAGF